MAFPKGKLSNHPFSGDMLVSGSVYSQKNLTFCRTPHFSFSRSILGVVRVFVFKNIVIPSPKLTWHLLVPGKPFQKGSHLPIPNFQVQHICFKEGVPSNKTNHIPNQDTTLWVDDFPLDSPTAGNPGAEALPMEFHDLPGQWSPHFFWLSWRPSTWECRIFRGLDLGEFSDGWMDTDGSGRIFFLRPEHHGKISPQNVGNSSDFTEI